MTELLLAMVRAGSITVLFGQLPEWVAWDLLSLKWQQYTGARSGMAEMTDQLAKRVARDSLSLSIAVLNRRASKPTYWT